MTPDLNLYRPNVGVVLFDRTGRVWFGRRAGLRGDHAWQFPQGGADPGEGFETAARRELYEETGVRSVRLLAETPGWIAYAFPPEYAASGAGRGFRGQKQKWFAYRFLGDDAEIDLEAHGEAEFDAWRWGRLSEACDLVVPFKRDAYRQVVRAFAPFDGTEDRV